MEENDDVGKFWQLVENLVTMGVTQAGLHYNFNKNVLVLKLQDIYPLYLKVFAFGFVYLDEERFDLKCKTI